MKDEDEKSLKWIENGEDVRHDDGAIAHVEDPKHPGQAEKYDQGY